MHSVGIALEILDRYRHGLVGLKKFTGHMVLDVNMDIKRKACWVLDGHRNPDLEVSLYDVVVSRENVRIALTHMAFNGLNMFASNTRNAYLQ